MFFQKRPMFFQKRPMFFQKRPMFFSKQRYVFEERKKGKKKRFQPLSEPLKHSSTMFSVSCEE